ncbi:UNVERIFIED_CONTAM: hypothetical protein K2H54_035191, partial [Gekko kuhli]
MDFTPFSQWWTEHQAQQVQEVTQHQQTAQAALLWDLHQVFEANWPVTDAGLRGAGGVAPSGLPGQGNCFPLAKLGSEDDVEAFLET